MLFLNEKEEKIIGVFINNTDKYENERMVLKWKDGSFVVATFDTYIEDEDDCDIEDENYEEFWSFVFKVHRIEGEPPVFITQHDYFLVNYRNFPDEIIAKGKKIN